MDRKTEFFKLFVAHQGGLRAFLGSLIRDRHTRDDVFQELSLTLWEQLDSYDPARPFAPWARGIAARKILERRRQDARFPLTFSPETIQAVIDAYDRREAAVSQRSTALRQCVDELPDTSKELLTLKYEEGIPAEEIGRRTGRSPDAIYQAFSRLLDRLEDCVQGRMKVQDGVL